MNHRAYIFDFDGTLVDSMPYVAKHILNFLHSRGICTPENIIEILTPLGYAGSTKYFSENFGFVISPEEYFKTIQKDLFPDYRDTIPLKDGAQSYLQSLKQQGAVLAILTATPGDIVKTCLDRMGVTALFDHIWCCDEFGTVKSDPNLYLKVADILNLKPHEIAFFDDNIHSLATAKQVGMYTVGVYDDSGKTFEKDMNALSDRYLSSFHRVNDI